MTRLLNEKGFTINIETSGTHQFSGTFDWVCFSPKKFKTPHPSIYQQADELKAIIFHKSDFEFAEYHGSLIKPQCKKILQPEWSKAHFFTNSIIEYVKNHPNWKISLQTHKFMDIP